MVIQQTAQSVVFYVVPPTCFGLYKVITLWLIATCSPVGSDSGYLTLSVNREKYNNGSIATRKFQYVVRTGEERMEIEWITGGCANG